MWNYNFYIYITTNPARTTLYIGVTNDLARRLHEHFENKGTIRSFAGKNYCYNLIYYEHFTHIEYAIDRETELKSGEEKRRMP
jgi:putative endonuclease